MSTWRYTFQEKLLDFGSVFENPKLDPNKTAVVFALLIAVTLLVFAVGLAVFIHITRKLKKRDGGEPRAFVAKKTKPPARLTPTERRLGRLAVGIILCGTFFYGTTQASQPNFCTNCHTMRPAYESWKISTHKNVPCNACHARPGLTGYFSRQISLASEGAAEAKGGKSSPEATVANSSCLRCHSEVLTGTLKTKALKVRHSDFLEQGAACVECHTSHNDDPKSSMSRCVICHNGTDASRKCSTCHRKDIGERAKKRRSFVKINLPPIKNCSGCHAVNLCSSHHGTEMPHQSGWLQAHGKIADSTNEPSCWRCHDRENYRFCSTCHSAIPPHNVRDNPGWIEKHQFVVRGENPSSVSACNICHEVDFCSGCHDQDGPRVFNLIRN